jgi:hypothetical protein
MKLFPTVANEHARGPEADAYVRRWLARAGEKVAKIMAIGAVGWAFMTLVFLPFLIAVGPFLWIVSVANVGTMACGAFLVWRAHRGLSIIALTAAFQLALAVATASFIAHLISVEAVHGWLWPFALAATVFSLGMCIPLVGWRARLLTVAFAGSFAYGLGPLGHPVEALVSILILGWVLFVMRWFLESFLRESARQEYTIEFLAALAERRKAEQELEVARRIQDSFTADEPHAAPGGLAVSWLQSRLGKVGGDWVVTRSLADGRLIAMVIDATGKGVQAALVVHAVQSLWADSLGDESFDPEVWIRRVNATLVRLGEREPHSLTMGLLLVGAGKLEYWSAGHVPIYLAGALDQPNSVQTLTAGGTPLGLGPLPRLTPAILPLPAGELHVLLGSDGVFTKGTRMRRAEILDILRDLSAGGPGAMMTNEQTDDQTLVWLRRAA